MKKRTTNKGMTKFTSLLAYAAMVGAGKLLILAGMGGKPPKTA